MKQCMEDGRWIKIYKTDDIFVFKIYPRNNKNQELGVSKEYQTLAECKTASENFIQFILDKAINDKNSKYITFTNEKQENNCYYHRYLCTDEANQPLFYQRNVWSKKSAQNGVASLYNTLEKAYGGPKK